MSTQPSVQSITNDLLSLSEAQQVQAGIKIRVTDTNFWRVAEIFELPSDSNDDRDQVCEYLREADIKEPEEGVFIVTKDDIKAMPALFDATAE